MEMEKEVKLLNLDDILPNRFQPRIRFNENAILELSESIKEHGVIQPIVVRKISDKYEIIAGERRYKASLLAGKTTIPAIVTTLDDKDSAEIALIENVQREDLTPIEEAISYKKILDMGYLNQTSLADKLGRTQSTIANKLRLLNLTEEVQEALLEQKISERHARSLLKIQDSKDQVDMLNSIINERLTVRKTDEEINKYLENQDIESLDVEILDLDNEEYEGGTQMSEDLNIPTEKIIEPISSINNIEPENNMWNNSTDIDNMETADLSYIQDIVKQDTPSPGFMDIEQIENNAQDIFKEEEIIPTDINMLLKEEPSLPKPEQPVSPMAPITPQEDENLNQQSSSKFFNMFNFGDSLPQNDNDLEEQQVNMDFGQPKINDTFMFNFNPLNQKVEESVESVQGINEEQVMDNIVENQSEGYNFNKLEPTMDDSLSNTFENPITSSSVTSFNQQSLENDTTSSYMSNLDDKEFAPVDIKPLENQSVENVYESSNPSSNFAPANNIVEPEPFKPFQPYSLNDDVQFTQNNLYQQLPTEIEEEQPTINNFNPEINTNNNVIEDSSMSFSNGVNNPLPIVEEPVEKRGMNEVLQVLQECQEKIQSYGYQIDLSEMDLGDIYQIVVRIEK